MNQTELATEIKTNIDWLQHLIAEYCMSFNGECSDACSFYNEQDNMKGCYKIRELQKLYGVNTKPEWYKKHFN